MTGIIPPTDLFESEPRLVPITIKDGELLRHLLNRG